MERKLAFIYKITNVVNKKIYIGKSSYSSLCQLISRYHKEIKYRKPPHRLIIRAMIKYGIDSFVFEVIESNICQDNINDTEVKYIRLYNTTDRRNGYNLTVGGDGTVGLKWSDEARESASVVRKNGDYTGENNPFFGKHHKKDAIGKIIESNKRRGGTKRTPTPQKTKDKISEKTQGRIPWNKGKRYYQIEGSLNHKYKEIDVVLFMSMVENGIHYLEICEHFDISTSHYYRKLKRLLNEKFSVNTESD